MIGLLTWTTYGTWLPGPARGRVDPTATRRDEPPPEPDETISARRRRSLKWPAVRLDAGHRAAVLEDLPRLAALRRFGVLAAVVAPDHVHLLIEVDDGRDVDRLIQLIKGALSRKLSVAAGDDPAISTSARPLPHHKWWTRQHSFRPITDDRALDGTLTRLREHQADDVDVLINHPAEREHGESSV